MALQCDVYLCTLRIRYIIAVRMIVLHNYGQLNIFKSFVMVKITMDEPLRSATRMAKSSTSVEKLISGPMFIKKRKETKDREKNTGSKRIKKRKKRKVCFFVYNVITHAIIP